MRECVSVCLCMFALFLLCFLVCVNQSINIVFSVCSHRGDIRQKQKTKTIVIIYTNFATGLWTIDLAVLVITSVLYKISLTLL